MPHDRVNEVDNCLLARLGCLGQSNYRRDHVLDASRGAQLQRDCSRQVDVPGQDLFVVGLRLFHFLIELDQRSHLPLVPCDWDIIGECPLRKVLEARLYWLSGLWLSLLHQAS